MNEHEGIERIPIADLKVEDGSTEMSRSPSMQPYMRLAQAVVKKEDPAAALADISKLPLEQRYVWRVASALKWAFCDLDDLSVEADRRALEGADLKKVLELLRFRPVQFCIFLKALLGEEEMDRVMREALAMAKQC